MDKRTRRITITAMMTALSLAALYIACVFPTGQLGFVAVASLFGIAAVIEGGLAYGVFVYIGVSLLGLLIMPVKGMVYLYIIFFGLYPILKSLFERLPKRVLTWLLKLVFFNAALSVVWFLLGSAVFSSKILSYGAYIVYIGGNIVFIIYDIGVSRLIMLYETRIARRMKR